MRHLKRLPIVDSVDDDENSRELLADAPTERLLATLTERPWTVLRVAPRGATIAADLRASPGGERLRLISEDDFGRVAGLSEIVYFLPQRHWNASHTEVLLGELIEGRATALALLPPVGSDPVSYLDFQLVPDDEVEIGFCMTHPEWRRRGLMTRLLATLVLLNFRRRIVVSTSTSNAAMRRVLSNLGFDLDHLRPNDRLNGETTMICARAAGTPFDLGASSR